MKYATRNEDGTISYYEISDKKKCITNAEWQSILTETTLKDHVYSSGSDFKYDEYGRRVAYFWAKFNHYAGFPLLVADIHSRFGRGVEIFTLDRGYPNFELRIRAYNNWR